MSLKNFLNHKYNIEFNDLYELEGLEKVDLAFKDFFKNEDVELFENFYDYEKNSSDVLIEVSKILEKFISDLFLIGEDIQKLKQDHEELAIIHEIKKSFIQRNISKKFSANDVGEINGKKILDELSVNYEGVDDLEISLAKKISENDKDQNLINYSIWALFSNEGKLLHESGSLFILPQKIDHFNLLKKDLKQELRDNFSLIDNGFSLNRSLAEAKYCIFCHKQDKDSCRSGLVDKKTEEIKIDPLGVQLNGCPLDERISEMNLLKSLGFAVSSLAMAVMDNPMIASTGHRICNDCMKSCIYQKQDPVDIPQVETRVLKDVLGLPYGFEIYSLLTRWNPLECHDALPKKKNGKKILVCGLGPAGFGLAHSMMQKGYEITAIDGLKIEPLNKEISGVDEFGNRAEFRPIKYLDEIYEDLDSRLIGGFGGVAEYGITPRWDKNFLKVIRLLLERRKDFKMFGGIRFGSSITQVQAFEEYGFDHVALCLGAGRPNIINLKNNFAKGVRSASDFLMSLQLTGSFRENLFSNLQVRLPIIVIGAGLTATDTATESKTYYITQIRKFVKRAKEIGYENILPSLSDEEKEIANEYFRDFDIYEKFGIREVFKRSGEVKVLYRKELVQSPAYKQNHEEINGALKQGIIFIENITPSEAVIDDYGHIKALKCDNGEEFECRTLLVAAGTTPNIAAKLEDKLDFDLQDEKYFKTVEGYNVITKINADKSNSVSFLGDLNSIYEGSVVKALASAKKGSKEIDDILQQVKNKDFEDKISQDFGVSIHKINPLSDHVVEIFIKAPLLAKNTEIGHIFRLQNYHALAGMKDGQLMALEGVAVTAVHVDKEEGIIGGVVIVGGGSTSLIKNFQEGEPCIFMGPSGKPTDIKEDETVILIGGGRGNQVLTRISKLLKYQKNCKVIFFAGYQNKDLIVQKDLMLDSCDELVISTIEQAEGYFHGPVTHALVEYFDVKDIKVDRVFTIGNDKLMHEIAKIRHKNLAPPISSAKYAIASLNSSMQCMLKGVCSQCLQKRINDEGKEEYFYSCADQDQNMDKFDFEFLHKRCAQNSLMEKVSKKYMGILK